MENQVDATAQKNINTLYKSNFPAILTQISLLFCLTLPFDNQ